MSLRERLLALAAEDWHGVAQERRDAIAIIAARLALEDAARECDAESASHLSAHGRAIALSCATRIRALAEGLDDKKGA